MSIQEWEKHTLLADNALNQQDYLRCILHYQQALAISDQLEISDTLHLDDLLTIKVTSCHNLANFWRMNSDEEYELKYLQLASERLLTLVPQCPNRGCDSFVESLGCCQKALVDFMKRHPNPEVAKHVQHIDTASNCNVIAHFKLN
ncbi:DUF2753 family protein [Vibrio sp. SCSIO 43136]|uniref:DUF2753 family protein n=1 Tax=Vibrio sp. SCSIO 43136 TaxID=2819101 RepID=UPI0020756564|nr:DUF2753 family protein [Vibrio sp. SCSIO 43136]USD66096.1 DUF2753 domain-containing protein [Vibrio sp. SCSIO 43136]